MHFHLATVLLLVPLLTAAPTPNLEQRVPCGAPTTNLERRVPCGDTTKKEPLGGHLPELPIGNARRQTSSGLPDTIIGALVEIAKSRPDEKREEPKGLTDTLASTVAGLTEPLGGDVPVLPAGNARRQSSGLPDTIVDALVAIAHSQDDQKREEPKGLTDTLASTLAGLTEPLGGDVPVLPAGNARRQSSGLPDTIVDALVAIAHSQDDQKREEPKGLTDTLASTLAGLTEPLGGDVPVLPAGNARRQSSGLPDTIVDALVEIAKSRPDEKRDSENPTDAVAAVLGTITGALGKAGGKRQTPDAATDILADVLKQVTAAMEETKDQSSEPSRKRQSDDPAAALSALVGMLTGAAGKAGGAKAKRFGVDLVGIAKDAVVDKVIGAASGST
ncbi:hypothetical protein ACLOAV_003602 [Pseudogymnoascus australis]